VFKSITEEDVTSGLRDQVHVSYGKLPFNNIIKSMRWVDNIKMDLGEMGWDCMDWIDLAQDSDQWRVLVNTVMNLRVP
jgi:hypothetical protein